MFANHFYLFITIVKYFKDPYQVGLDKSNKGIFLNSIIDYSYKSAKKEKARAYMIWFDCYIS